MKVRAQLILAFLLLAVVPLAGIVLYSYWTSLGTFRSAVRSESRVLAEEMGERLDDVRHELSLQLEDVATLPERPVLAAGTESALGPAATIYTDLVARLGSFATLVDWLEFTPSPSPSEGETETDEAPAGTASAAAGLAAAAGSGDGEWSSASAVEPFFIYPSKTLIQALEKLKKFDVELEESGLSQEYLATIIRQAIRQKKLLQADELQAVEARGEEVRKLLGAEFTAAVRRGDEVVGWLKALVPPGQLLRQVLSRIPRDRGEVPYARDETGKVFVDRKQDKVVLAELGLPSAGADPSGKGWILVEMPDEESGLTFGVARPIQSTLSDFRNTAARNFGAGLALVVLAMVGILLLSARMTRSLSILTTGAERLAGGDLTTRVPIKSKDEFGLLARTLNRMAHELSENQRRFLQQERQRKEQEIQRRLLEAENDRKSRELEEAREFQLSLLPTALPDHPELDIAVFMRTATEVGGDYYDFFPGDNGDLTTAIGDAAGHGVRAGTMVTVVKGLFTAGAAGRHLAEILGEATSAIKRMNLGRMNMAVSLVRIGDGRVTISAAGMPPMLLWEHATKSVHEIALTGTPLGSMADVAYQEWGTSVAAGDTILLMTDGFPELLNEAREPMGYERVRKLFAETAAGSGSPQEIISQLSRHAERWNGGRPPEDDITFVVMKVKEAA